MPSKSFYKKERYCGSNEFIESDDRRYRSYRDAFRVEGDDLWQSVWAPLETMTDILARREGVRALFDNRRLHLFALDETGRMAWRYAADLGVLLQKVFRPLKSARSHLSWLESESIHILREAVAEARNPVMLFSAGKDSTVMAHLALRAFYPCRPPFPLLHVDSTWEFGSLIAFRDDFAGKHHFKLIAYSNEEGRSAGINPFDHGDRYTLIMRTQPLKTALDAGHYDVIFGGARRDEEKSRAKERIVSVRGAEHSWDPRQQRPELWRLYNTRVGTNQTLRVFPLSNWTESDIWAYALLNEIELAPLYFAAPRPVVQRAGAFIVVDDENRMRFRPGEEIQTRSVRFRTLGCWPDTGAIESEATNLAGVVAETLRALSSERQGRISDGEAGGSLEQKKREGYF